MAHALPQPPASCPARRIGFGGEDEQLAQALAEGHPGAPTALVDKYADHVQRVLRNVLGPEPEFQDVLHEVFVRAFAGVGRLRDGNCLKAWITRIAVFTARSHIKAKARRRWMLRFAGDHQAPPEPSTDAPCPAHRQAVRSAYRVLDRMSADLRLVFVLRFVQGMQLVDVAAACGVSLATVKRRLQRAEKRFAALARNEPALTPWLARSPRWRPADE